MIVAIFSEELFYQKYIKYYTLVYWYFAEFIIKEDSYKRLALSGFVFIFISTYYMLE